MAEEQGLFEWNLLNHSEGTRQREPLMAFQPESNACKCLEGYADCKREGGLEGRNGCCTEVPVFSLPWKVTG